MANTFMRHTALIALSFCLIGCNVLPKPFNDVEKKVQAQDDKARLNGAFKPLPKRLTASQAVARSLKYNLDYLSMILILIG